MQTVAAMTATAAAAGVIDVDAVHAETVLAEVADALPILKAEIRPSLLGRKHVIRAACRSLPIQW
ncbi:hypothetical protein M0D46_02315 [Xanthomonas prunicola]|nr:hypothetical protein M0D48_15625 [Xanthomonas prunicola]UXA69958.1 hypothetical protein M0D46_02315 [Xanthomonas prunicola]